MGTSLTLIIILSTVVPIAITIVILVAVFKKAGSASGAKILQNGRPGTAQITGLQQGNMVVNMTNYECHIAMNITLPGEAPYEAVITQLIPLIALSRVQPGTVVAVKVDQTDKTKAAIDFNSPVQAMPGAMVPSAGMPMGAAPLSGGGAVASAGMVAVGVAAGIASAGPGNVPMGPSSADLLASGQRVLGVLTSFADTGSTPRSMGVTPSNPSYIDDPMYALTLTLHVPNMPAITAQPVQRVPRAQVPNLRMGWELNCAVNPANPSQEVAVDWGD